MPSRKPLLALVLLTERGKIVEMQGPVAKPAAGLGEDMKPRRALGPVVRGSLTARRIDATCSQALVNTQGAVHRLSGDRAGIAQRCRLKI